MMLAKKPSPEAVLKYGHIAAAIRDAMKKQKITRSDLARLLNATPSAVSWWTTCKGAPNDEYRKKLSNVLHIPEAMLMTSPPQAKPPQAVIATERARPVLSFEVSDDGTARIKMDVTLPLDVGAPLLRTLLDAGITLGRQI